MSLLLAVQVCRSALAEIIIKNQWALALVKGIREPHEVKKKSFDLGGNRLALKFTLQS